MGPRSEDRGDVGKRLYNDLRWRVASMGPRSEDRGDDRHITLFNNIALRASMGPRSEDRGDAGVVVAPPIPSERFNGSTVRGPW